MALARWLLLFSLAVLLAAAAASAAYGGVQTPTKAPGYGGHEGGHDKDMGHEGRGHDKDKHDHKKRGHHDDDRRYGAHTPMPQLHKPEHRKPAPRPSPNGGSGTPYQKSPPPPPYN